MSDNENSMSNNGHIMFDPTVEIDDYDSLGIQENCIYSFSPSFPSPFFSFFRLPYAFLLLSPLSFPSFFSLNLIFKVEESSSSYKNKSFA